LTTLLIVNRLDDGTSIVATTPRIAGRPDETDGHTETIVNTPSVVSRILVVDDDASVGAAVRMILDREGCKAVHVTDADTGIRAFEASRFDLVMVDIFMPTVNGLKAIAEFRTRSPALPIVAMSGFRFRESMDPDLDFFKMAIKLGATGCLRKPFTPRQLMTVINASLGFGGPGERPAANQELGQGTSR
jgi:DNA-binding response OmpR family regulator